MAEDSNNAQKIEMFVNHVARSLNTSFPDFYQGNPKHNFWVDFGFPDHITFTQYFQAYKRSGLGKAGIQRPIQKTWRDYPVLVTDPEVHEQNEAEKAVADAFERLMFWEMLADADEKSRVGTYSAIIFRFGDNKEFKEPVEGVTGGLNGLIELIPVYCEQLKVATIETDERSENYGMPTMFNFNESAVIDPSDKTQNSKTNRAFEVHPDRVHIWSKDSTTHGTPSLEAGYNDLITIEKINGAGGEGFWKNAKVAPVLDMDKDASPESFAAALGVPVADLTDKLDEIIGDWQKGFDKLLFTQGVKTTTLDVTLPQPKEFLEGAIQSFAASLPIPMKVLLGSQTGERASTEDNKEWCATISSRRTNYVIPNINRVVMKLEGLQILTEADWSVLWTDLTEATSEEKAAKASKMAEINAKLLGSGEIAFDVNEIREAMDFEPRDDLDDLTDDIEEGDESDSGNDQD